MTLSIHLPDSPHLCRNLTGAGEAPPRTPPRTITSPYDGRVIGHVHDSDLSEVARAATAAHAAFFDWARTPLRERTNTLLRFRQLVHQSASQLANTVAIESGKTPDEARAGITRGLEVVDFAIGLLHSDRGGALEVSRGVTCEIRREPLGVALGITPFNFPAMVPMWMFPIALTVGNTFILKPSEKVPLTACRLGELMTEAGYPTGVFSVVHGGRSTAEALVEHPLVRAVGFVGSTPAAKSVYARATAGGKRSLCLGGAKNAVIVAPDADENLTVQSVVDSFTGCAGQRCMAASLLIAVGNADSLIDKVAETAARIDLGTTLGALIDPVAKARLEGAIQRAKEEGATILLDGRQAAPPAGFEKGNWLGPTIVDQAKPEMECAREELFGPVLTIIRARTLEEALAIDAQSPYGNATSVFTTSGAIARYVAEHSKSGMVGVNVGVPVPRDPFSFGGTRDSKFGSGDMTGPSAVEFWSNLKKITTKWALQPDATWMS